MNAHKDGDFAFGVELTCLNVPGGGMNERRKFNDTMRVTQWLIDNLEKKVLGDSDAARMDVCVVADKIEEKVMRHAAALEEQKDWNGNRMRAMFTGFWSEFV